MPFALCLPAVAPAQEQAKALKVASLHPLVSDLLRQVGGERVEIVEVVSPGQDLHSFRPGSKAVRAMSGCHAVFASGKGFEPYLKGLSDSLGEGRLIEVGRAVPSQRVSGNGEVYGCCPHHSHGTADPHWWHHVDSMRRATCFAGKELARLDPAGANYYKSRSKAAENQLRRLERWVKAEVAKVPRERRRLVTAHGAFGYFCKAYGFKASHVQGLSKEGEISARQLAGVIATLKKEKIAAVFPEQNANPKVLAQIAKQSGAKVGQPLIADGATKSYEAMVRQNVTRIVRALAPAPAPAP